MASRGVNRIMIAVSDLEVAKRRYADLLGARFEDAHWTGEPFGIRVSIAWEAGIELCSPMPGREHDSAVSQFLAMRGEGIMSVFFDVDDGDAALAQARASGYECKSALDYSQEEIDRHLGGHFSRYQEFVLGTHQSCGFTVCLARIEEK